MVILLPEVKKSDLGTKTYTILQPEGRYTFKKLEDLIQFQKDNDLITIGEYLELPAKRA